MKSTCSSSPSRISANRSRDTKSRTLSQWAIASRNCAMPAISSRRSQSRTSPTFSPIRNFIDVLQIGQPVEEQDALDQFIGIFHLVDRLIVFILPELGHAPVFQH